MKHNLHRSLLFLLFTIPATLANSQTRYLNEVFTSITKTSNVQYAENMSVFPPSPNGTTLIPLTMDVYEPAGDSLPNRPLIILMHTGSYLPIYCNQTPTGSKDDSATVELATQFAKRGYVVANIDYRLGWNPGGSTVDIRRGTLLQAVYRSIHDAKACVRYFRKDYEQTNQFQIDTNKIILGGQGTGGYIALNYISLDKPSELNIPKLISGSTEPSIPITAGQSYINTSIHGDLDGYGGIPQLNNPNNSVGYSNKVHFAFNLGGALGDSTWIEPGDVPTVAFHVVGDPYAPFGPGIVWVPGNPPQPVIDVIGSGSVLELANQYGNNDCFANYTFTDPYTIAANSINNGYEGLFPFYMVPPDQSGPWEWWDPATVIQNAPACGADGNIILAGAATTNPNMSKTKALAYIDTVMGYLNPRLVECLKLVGIKENEALSSNIKIGPNPATDFVQLEFYSGIEISAIEIFDVVGKRVKSIPVTEDTQYRINVTDLSDGSYFIRIQNADAIAVKKLIIQ